MEEKGAQEDASTSGGSSVDELRQRLNGMKRLLAEREKSKVLDEQSRRSKSNYDFIDGYFLSAVMGGALFVIISVSVYAFYSLYIAFMKKFYPTPLEELK